MTELQIFEPDDRRGAVTPRTTIRYTAMGKRQRERQPIVGSDDRFRNGRESPILTRLNQLLREHGFDDFAEGQCARFYADTTGRPGLPPGIYFRLLLIGYFEGIDSVRGIAWRAVDSSPSIWRAAPPHRNVAGMNGFR